MKRLASPAAVVAACALIVVTNAVVLVKASRNRSGEPEAVLALTERELAMPFARQDEGTALDLRLVTSDAPPLLARRASVWRRREIEEVEFGWLDRAKLLDLGCRIDIEPDDPKAEERYDLAIPRSVYLVLEYDGDAWGRWIAGREESVAEIRSSGSASEIADAEALLALDREMRSRLFPIDAGTDLDLLRRRYPDRSRHVILAGAVRPRVVEDAGGEQVLRGRIDGLFVGRVHVPRRLADTLAPFAPKETWEEIDARMRRETEGRWPEPVPPRFSATLAVGHRLEPWLVEVSAETTEPR